MDRNWQDIDDRETIAASLSARRAWIEILQRQFAEILQVSLSARRAWIEIAGAGIVGNTDVVALRKESVDRNCNVNIHSGYFLQSLSARRAWIEIKKGQAK